MAQKYAARIGEKRGFQTVEEAIQYLSEKQIPLAIAHEFAHTMHNALKVLDPEYANNYAEKVKANGPLIEKIKKIQADKYGEEMPINIIIDEAFAEDFGPQIEEAMTGKPGTSRL